MIYRAINGLIRHAIEAELITNDDIFVVRNQLMDILKLTDWNDKEPLTGNIEELLKPVIDYAVKAGLIEDTAVQRDLFDTRVMGVFTPMPREVNATFQRKYSASPSAATEWYYAFSKSLNYVRAERIAKDLKWTYESEYGTLDITINRSKPEKDPRDTRYSFPCQFWRTQNHLISRSVFHSYREYEGRKALVFNPHR